MTKAADPIVEALASAKPLVGGHGGSGGRIEYLFGDNEAVKNAIRTARVDQKLSYAHIAKTITKAMQQIPELQGQGVGKSAIGNWLDKQGIK